MLIKANKFLKSSNNFQVFSIFYRIVFIVFLYLKKYVFKIGQKDTLQSKSHKEFSYICLNPL